jgi:hypothetical protein
VDEQPKSLKCHGTILVVVDNHTEEITPFNLNPKGSEVSVEKKNGKIFILETEGDGKSK